MFTDRTREPARRRRTSMRFLFRARAALGLAAVLPLTTLAVVPVAASAPVPPPSPACGTYPCFLDAAGFLQSATAPFTGQVATVPLATRAVGPAAGTPSMLVGLDNGPRAFWTVSDGFAQGRSGLVGGVSTGNVYNFGHWQYVDELYYYFHALVSVPPTQWVNAGHRNGVPVLGAVTGDCHNCDAQANVLFSAANYHKTVRKLYRYAVDYGFDGWVIDMENGFQPSDTVLAAVKELSAMVLPNHQPVRVVVYHAQESTLAPPYAKMLPYFEAGAGWQADYSTLRSDPMQTYQTLRDSGLRSQRFRAHWSSYVYDYQADCEHDERTTSSQIWNGNPGTKKNPAQCLSSQNLFNNQRFIVPSPPATRPRYYTSTGLFAPEWTYFGNLDDTAPGPVPVGPENRTLVHAADDALWAGAGVRYSGRKCARSGTDTGNAVSSLITPRSVVGRLPFVTNFNEGEGDVYAIDGKPAAAQPWNNLSAQDVPPTWYCTQGGDLAATPVYATAAHAYAFNGGSALALTGRGAGQVALYDTRIRIAAGSLPALSFVSKTVTGALPYVRISFSDGTSQTVRRTVPGAGWRQTTSLLRARGKTIVQVSAGFAGRNRPNDTVLGQVRLYDTTMDTRPSPVYVTSTDPTISWTTARRPAISYWNVYMRAGRCLRFLGPAFTPAYSVAQSMFAAGKRTTHFVIQPVSASGSAAVLKSAGC